LYGEKIRNLSKIGSKAIILVQKCGKLGKLLKNKEWFQEYCKKVEEIINMYKRDRKPNKAQRFLVLAEREVLLKHAPL
jgi:hypothetical protein